MSLELASGILNAIATPQGFFFIAIIIGTVLIIWFVLKKTIWKEKYENIDYNEYNINDDDDEDDNDNDNYNDDEDEENKKKNKNI